MKKLIFAYWIIYEYFYKRRKRIKPNNLRKQWRAAYKRLNNFPAWYYTAQAIHEEQKADK